MNLYTVADGRQLTEDQMRAELQRAGYQGPWDIGSMLYAFQGAQPAKQAQQAPEVDADWAAWMQEYQGADREKWEELNRQWQSTFDWQREEFERQGMPRLAIEQQLANMQGEQADRMYDLALKQFEFDKQRFGHQQQMDRAGFGLDITKTAASMGGPSNWVQAANFARGMGQQADTPLFLQSMLNNQTSSAFSAPGGPAPTPQSIGSIVNNMSGGGLPDTQASQRMANEVFNRGGGALAPGVLESMSDTERQMLGSAGYASGYDVPSYLEAWRKSRVGQTAMKPS